MKELLDSITLEAKVTLGLTGMVIICFLIGCVALMGWLGFVGGLGFSALVTLGALNGMFD